MKIKSVAVLSPLFLCLFAGSARADLEPYSFGASETIGHQSNIVHADESARRADWLSTTEFRAALNQALGRDKLVGSVTVDLNRYKRLHQLNSTGYLAAAEFDWNTVGDLSGAIGADSHRQQFVYGDTADLSTTSATAINLRNLQTDNHVFARAALGGESRWTIYGGVDANRRSYSSAAFRSDEERQWSTNAGTRYSTSPDLSFGLQGNYTDGEYPHYGVPETVAHFSVRAINATTKWQASGNSQVNASLGYSTEDSEALASKLHFVDGSLNWVWTPPSHFTVTLGVKRSSDADTSTASVNTGVLNENNLNGPSINNEAHLDVTYALTAKISLDASADYTQRKYSDVKQISLTATPLPDVNGTARTSRFFLTAHYQPTRTTDLSCGGGREARHVDATLVTVTPAYTDNYLQCVASIRFD